MAKDRFSNQKKSNYISNTVHYTQRSLTYDQYQFVKNLLKLNMRQWDTTFCKSILERNVKLSVKQTDVLKSIILRYK
jgi:hypothetical protein